MILKNADATVTPLTAHGARSSVAVHDLGTGPHKDAFGRLRVSNSHIALTSTLLNDKQPLLWAEKLVTGGTVAHSAPRASVALSVTTAAGSSAIRQTRRYWRYRAGQSQRIVMTAIIGVAVDGVRKRIGYFDDDDGIFIEQADDGTLAVVVRSSVTGSPVETRVPQAEWNGDTADGTGLSGVTLAAANIAIFWVDLQWLGAGDVRCFINVAGRDILLHRFSFAGAIDSVYMSRASLPVRYEITNVGGSASAATLEQVCSGVQWEGGEEDPGIRGAAHRDVSAAGMTTALQSILSVRLRGDRLKSVARVVEASVLNDDNAILRWCLLWNPTVTLTTWTDVNADGVTEQCLDVAAVTGGYVIASGYISGGSNQNRKFIDRSIDQALALGRDVDGVPDQIVLAGRVTAGTGNVYATIGLKDLH